MKIFCRILMLLSVLAFSSCARTDMPAFIPMPEHVDMGAGFYALPSDPVVACPDSSYLTLGDFAETCLPSMELAVSDDGDIVILPDQGLKEGEYVLDVKKNRIRISTGSYAGAVYAFATLGQMISDGMVPVSCISDSPRFGWRGFMLDVSRHFFSVEEVKTILLKMAQYKFNRFHWHLTDDQGWRIEIKAYPQLTAQGAWRDHENHGHDVKCADIARSTDNPSFILDASKVTDKGYGGFYTQEEIREIVAFAASLGIEVIPEIDMPGHSLKVVEAFPELSCGGVAKWGNHFSVPLCPGNDDLLTFAKNVYREVFELFPYQYVHIGADEVEQVHWKNCPKCQARVRNLGLKDETALQAWFVSEMHDFFSENGKVMIGWDEIVSGDAPEDAVVMWWRGWRPDTRDAAAEAGHDLIISSSEYLYLAGDQNRNSLAKVYGWDPVMDGLEAHQDKVLGIQAHLWTELCPSFANACGRIFPRLFAVSETAWSRPEQKDFKDFESRVMKHIRDFDAQGLNYRIPDISGFCDENVFIDSVVVEVEKPFDDLVVRYTSDGSVPRSDSPVYEDPLTVKEECVLHFRSYTSEGMPGDIYRARYSPAEYIEAVKPADDFLEPGLKADWYEYRGEACDSIETSVFNASYIIEGVYIPEEVRGNIGLVFTGYVNIPEDGIYSFYTYSDDGSYIKIDGRMVVDNDGPHSRVERSGQAALEKGLHSIEARYFDHSGGILEAGWIMPDEERRRFSAGDFFH